MTTKDEVEKIVSFWEQGKGNAKERVILYNCTSGYPVPFQDVCMLELKLRERFAGRVRGFGFSGHHLGISVDIARVRVGRHVERAPLHQGPTWKGTDHAASLEPAGLSKLCRAHLKAACGMSYKKTDILPLEAGAARQAQVRLLQPGPRQEDRRLDSPYFPCANVLARAFLTPVSSGTSAHKQSAVKVTGPAREAPRRPRPSREPLTMAMARMANRAQWTRQPWQRPNARLGMPSKRSGADECLEAARTRPACAATGGAVHGDAAPALRPLRSSRRRRRAAARTGRRRREFAGASSIAHRLPQQCGTRPAPAAAWDSARRAKAARAARAVARACSTVSSKPSRRYLLGDCLTRRSEEYDGAGVAAASVPSRAASREPGRRGGRAAGRGGGAGTRCRGSYGTAAARGRGGRVPSMPPRGALPT